MEGQIKQPTQPRQFSEADSKRIAEFKNLLHDWHAENLRQPLLQMYFRYTQLLARDASEITTETSNELYTLQLLIEMLA